MLLFTTLALVSSIVSAAESVPYADDSDLTGDRVGYLGATPEQTLRVERLFRRPLDEAKVLEIQVTLETSKFGSLGVPSLKFTRSQAELTTDQNGIATTQCDKAADKQVFVAELKAPGYEVRGEQGIYRLELEAECGTRTIAQVRPETDPGQALTIFRILSRAREKLSQTVDLRFWNETIPVEWPASGDFYSWGSVHITRGDYWDVVGHELGHAIYHLARVGSSAGGAHRIDECYSGALAISEGWASYFSAWVSLESNDGDAKFEYMVPRRAPIQIETIPSDVCDGPTNEWRVSSFFWDLIDLSNDGEGSDATFRSIWDALLRSGSSDVSSAYLRLKSHGVDSALLAIVWDLNFRTQRPN